tara:strand:+ start:1539 stop:1943 length:405 start_codon:yes stop_codon:yes gene_type:complete
MEIMLEKGLSLIVKTVLISAVLFSCNSDPRDWSRSVPPEDSGILGKSEFVDVMTDIYLVEASYKSNVYVNENKKLELEGNYASVFEKHGITQEQFEASHTWWWEHPAAMKGVLQEVTEKIISMEKSVYNQDSSK